MDSNYDDFVYDISTTTVANDLRDQSETFIQPQDFSYLFETNTDQDKEKILNLVTYDEIESKQFAQKILNVLNNKNEANKLKGLVITVSVMIVVCGILVNTIFNTIIVIRKRYTTYNIIKLTMCTSYLVYLIVFCFKISVYANDIQKYHIYDTLEPWAYGETLCQFINGLLPTCKFISRFSILMLSLKHLTVIYRIKANTQAIFYSTGTRVTDDASSLSFKWRLIRLLKPPHLLLPLGFLVVLSILVSLPIYNNYKLTPLVNSTIHICDCVYEYPKDNSKYAVTLFNYLVFGLILPCVLNFICLIVIVAVNLSNSLNFDDHSVDEGKLYLVIIGVFFIHITTTLPNDIYKYAVLISDDFMNVDYGIMQSIVDQLTQPIAQTKSYYYLQLLYVSEFLLVPCVFLLFYVYNTFHRNSCHKSHYNVTNVSVSSGSNENVRDLVVNRPNLAKRSTELYVQQASLKKTIDETNDYNELAKTPTNQSSSLSTNTSLSYKTDSLSQSVYTIDKNMRELTELPEASSIED
jgi:hypothetical protein